MLQKLAQLIRQPAEPDRGEVIDRKARIFRIVSWKQARKWFLQRWIFQPSVQLEQAHVLGELLEQNLDEYAARAGGVLFVQTNALQHIPADGVGKQQVCEEFTHIAQPVRIQSMRRGVRVVKDLLERGDVDLVYHAESLRQQTVKLFVRPLLGTAVEEHVAQLLFLPWLQLHLHQLVCALLVIETGVNRQVDGSSQSDQIGLRVVDDGILLLFGIIPVVRVTVGFVVVGIIAIAARRVATLIAILVVLCVAAKNFSADFFILRFVDLILRIHLEHVCKEK